MEHHTPDQRREEREEREQEEHELEHEQLVQQSLLNPSTIKPDPKPCPSSTFLTCAFICLGLFFAFFLLAPATSISHRASSDSSRPTANLPKFVKPTGPPGSITDKTDHWANQGGSWKSSTPNTPNSNQHQNLLSNGTHQFKKTLILVSLDGFRADYLERGLTPRLTTIKEKHGISAEYLRPQFPTLTFPNHWSMLTGLYPESHGIVANDFRDPKLGKSFNNIDPHKSWDPVWWLGEPIWATATKHNIRTAISMWPGPPYTSDKTRPTYWRAFEDRHKWWKKIRQLQNWLDLPLEERPEFVALYIPEVDQMGHHYGPDDPKFDLSLKNVDGFVGALYDCLEARNMSEIVDVVYVGDHGMMATSDQRIVYLDKILGDTFYEQIQFQDGWPAAGLRFPPEIDTKPIIERLMNQAKIEDGFEVYTHETMPKRWRFTQNDRIAPIYVFPKPGWVISNTHEHQVVMNGTYNVKGVHGYDNEEKLMWSIFISHGPFSKAVKQSQLRSIRDGRLAAREDSGASRRSRSLPSHDRGPNLVVGRLPGFSNLEIYSLAARLLKLDPFIDLRNTNCSIGFWDQFF